MADELLFSALGLETNFDSPTTIHDELSSPNSVGFFSDYETPCTTPSSVNSELFESLENPTSNAQDFYTDSVNSPEVSWNEWASNNPPPPGK